jgi:hypothetical protein
VRLDALIVSLACVTGTCLARDLTELHSIRREMQSTLLNVKLELEYRVKSVARGAYRE